MMKPELTLRNRLKAARAEKNLSQSELAEMVGVSRNTISAIETGQFNPTAKLAPPTPVPLISAWEVTAASPSV